MRLSINDVMHFFLIISHVFYDIIIGQPLPTCPGCCSTDCAVHHRSIFFQMNRSTWVNQSDVSIISANQRRVLPIEYVRTCLGHQSLHVNYGLTILTLPHQLSHQMIHFTQTFLKSFRFSWKRQLNSVSKLMDFRRQN